MSTLQYLAIQCCAFLGLYIGALILPKYDEILYPFVPDLRFLSQFWFNIFVYACLSSMFALIGSWVYKKTISFAILAAVVAITIDFLYSLFSKLNVHFFHFSYIFVSISGMYLSVLIIKKLANYICEKKHITSN